MMGCCALLGCKGQASKTAVKAFEKHAGENARIHANGPTERILADERVSWATLPDGRLVKRTREGTLILGKDGARLLKDGEVLEVFPGRVDATGTGSVRGLKMGQIGATRTPGRPNEPILENIGTNASGPIISDLRLCGASCTDDQITQILRSNLSKAASKEPDAEFDYLSGKLKLNRSRDIGPVRLKGGETNVYKVAGLAVGPVVLCWKHGNLDLAKKRYLPDLRECVRNAIRDATILARESKQGKQSAT
jgi:hypothetical protein